jgi:hypothetical protein
LRTHAGSDTRGSFDTRGSSDTRAQRGGRGMLATAALALVLVLALAGVHGVPARAAGAEGKSKAEAAAAAKAKATAAAKAKATAAATDAKTIEVEAQLSHAIALQKAGFPEEARKIIVTALQEAPPQPTGKLGQLSKKLEHLAHELRPPTQRPSRWQGLLGLYGPWFVVAAEAFAILLGAGLLVLLAISAVHGLFRRTSHAVRIEGFTGGSESTLSDALTASLGDALAQLKDERPSHDLHYQSSSEPKFEVPTAILESVPEAKLITGLIQMLDQLLPRKMSLISGTVHPVHENRGAGLTVLLANHSGREIDQVTLWESDLQLKKAGDKATDAVRYERLILPAAVWLAYRPEFGFKSGQAPLGTQDWRSYALFALGALVPDLSERRIMYERALDRDGDNLGARLNLAELLLRRPSEDVPGAAAAPGAAPDPDDGRREIWSERRAEARRHLEYVAFAERTRRDPVWYRARYMQIVLNIYDCQSAQESEEHKYATEYADQAHSCLAELRTALDHASGQQKPPFELLDAMQEPLGVLGYTVELFQRACAGPPYPTEIVQKEPNAGDAWLSDSAEYNLACFWSRYSAYTRDADIKRDRVHRAIVHLRRSIERTGNALVEEFRTDPAFEAIRDTDAFKSFIPPPPATPPPPAPSYRQLLADLFG